MPSPNGVSLLSRKGPLKLVGKLIKFPSPVEVLPIQMSSIRLTVVVLGFRPLSRFSLFIRVERSAIDAVNSYSRPLMGFSLFSRSS